MSLSCDCMSRALDRLAEKYKKNPPKLPGGHELDLEVSPFFENSAYILEGDTRGLNFTYLAGFAVKGQKKKYVVHLFGSFCPFCGKRLGTLRDGEVGALPGGA